MMNESCTTEQKPEAIELAMQLVDKLQAEVVEYNTLLEEYNHLQDLVVLERLENSVLRGKLAEYETQSGGQISRVTQLEQLLRKEKTKRVEVEKEHKALKAEGDIKSFKRRLKEYKEKNALQKKTIATLTKENKKLTAFQKKTIETHRVLEASPVGSFKSTGETLYLHPEKVEVATKNGKALRVVLKYWNPHGVGWLITSFGGKLSVTDANLENIPDELRPSQIVLDTCTEWFSTNVIEKGEKQYLK